MRASGLTVFFLDLGELGCDKCFELKLVGKYIFEILYLFLKSLDLLDSAEDVLAVKVAELDVGDVFSLNCVDIKALFQVWNNVLFVLGGADYLYRLVNVKKDLSKSEKEVELILLLFKVESKFAREAFLAEFDPFGEYFDNVVTN